MLDNKNYDCSNSRKIEESKQEADIIYFSKEELREILGNEQGWICCYCGQRIKNNHTTIVEHLEPKSINKRLTFDYKNLYASCRGGVSNDYRIKFDGERIEDIIQDNDTSLEDILSLNEDLDIRRQLREGDKIILHGKEAHCDHKKGNRPIFIKPLQIDCEIKFLFKNDGVIKTKVENDIETIKTIEILGLNDNDRIIKGRKKAWERASASLYILRSISSDKSSLKSNIKKLHDNLHQIQENRELREYCFVERAFLKQFL